MSWFEEKTEKPKIPPAKALWAICPKCKSYAVVDLSDAGCDYYG